MIHKQIDGVSFKNFIENEMLQQSILFGFVIIGEAAAKLKKDTKARYSEIEWASIIGFRNIIVHAYFSLNLLTVWKAAKRRVLPLADQVKAILRYDFSDADE